MAVNLSIEGVSDEIAKQLRRRAARNHRSSEGDLMAILEESERREKTETEQAARARSRVRPPDAP